MSTLTVKVDPVPEEHLCDVIKRDFTSAFEQATAGNSGRFTIRYPSASLLLKDFTPGRVQILEAMAGGGEMSMREVARRAGRDFRYVHTDLTALIKLDIVERTSRGVRLPYDEVDIGINIKASVAA